MDIGDHVFSAGSILVISPHEGPTYEGEVVAYDTSSKLLAISEYCFKCW